jgi:hypothetical protein
MLPRHLDVVAVAEPFDNTHRATIDGQTVPRKASQPPAAVRLLIDRSL